MNNPFDNPDGTYLVLVNDEGQYSLWPGFAEVPAGWRVALPENDRASCVDFVESHWRDTLLRGAVAD